MLPDIALNLTVMGILLAGTWFAMVRPADWYFIFGPEDESEVRKVTGIILTILTLLIISGGYLGPFRVPSGVPYLTFAILILLADLLAQQAVRSRLARAAVTVAGAAAATAWLVWANWVTYTAAASFTAVIVIALVRPRLPFWVLGAVEAAFAAWDYYGVIATHATEAEVAALDPFAGHAAIHGHVGGIPAMIGFPGHLALLSTYVQSIGPGDIEVPGFLIVIAGRAGRLAGTSWLYAAGIAGYAVGLTACDIVVRTTGSAMPALVFLVPGVIAAIAVAARLTGTWSALAGKDPGSVTVVPDTSLDAADA